MTGSNSIAADRVVVDYVTQRGTIRALDCDRLFVDGGSSLAIMGPSGCGKSTLLGLLAGLAIPTSGKVTIGEVEVSTMPESQRVRFRRERLGMVYQADNLLPHLTVEENVGLALSICGAGAATSADADPGEILDRLDLGSLAKRMPDQLSGGQRQRVAVARAIIHRPSVILADEPTGALDADSAATVIELLVELQRSIAATMVIVTHDSAIAERAEHTIELAGPPGQGGHRDAY